MFVGVCGLFRSLAPLQGARAEARGSRRAAPRLAHLLIQKKAPTTPDPSRSLGPGRGPIPTVAHADTIVVLAPAQGPIAAGLAVDPTAVSGGVEATAARLCPIAADTSAIAQIQIQTAAWECLV